MQHTAIERLLGVDVSSRALERAARRLHLETMTPRQRDRIALVQGSLVYTDDRLQGFDVAALVEVIEHVDPGRLPSLERAVWGRARPRLVVLTTPNVEHNARFPGLAAHEHRHHDHRFEWTRSELRAWGQAVADRYDYRLRIDEIGAADPEVGAPTQLAVFER